MGRELNDIQISMYIEMNDRGKQMSQYVDKDGWMDRDKTWNLWSERSYRGKDTCLVCDEPRFSLQHFIWSLELHQE